jgi:hypothetical protein
MGDVGEGRLGEGRRGERRRGEGRHGEGRQGDGGGTWHPALEIGRHTSELQSQR